jgi:hypothetical protein
MTLGSGRSGVFPRPRVFYHCYRHQSPTGGQKRTYRHVDILNASGEEAYVVHPGGPYRLTWFDNDTAVMPEADFQATFDVARDYLVLPEDLGHRVADYPGRKILFNKNVFLGFAALDNDTPSPYTRPDVVGAFTVSMHNAACLRIAYPALPIYTVGTFIDPARFRYRPLAAKEPQIACAVKSQGRTADAQLCTIRHLLAARLGASSHHGADWRWVWLKGLTEGETGRVLEASSILLFLSVEEGLPRLVLEGSMSGCLVVGFPFGPLRECPPLAFAANPGEPDGVVRFIESVIRDPRAAAASWQPHVDANRALTLEHSADRESRTVLEAWEALWRAA